MLGVCRMVRGEPRAFFTLVFDAITVGGVRRSPNGGVLPTPYSESNLARKRLRSCGVFSWAIECPRSQERKDPMPSGRDVHSIGSSPKWLDCDITMALYRSWNSTQ